MHYHVVVVLTLSKSALAAAANTGSPALTIWPKETAPAPRASTEKAWASAAHMPTGDSSFQLSVVRAGALRRAVNLT